MGTITRITPGWNQENKDFVFITVSDKNGKKECCVPVRLRTFPAIPIKLGGEITCSQLRELDSFFWKTTQYDKQSWGKEKVRLEKVCSWLCNSVNNIHIKLTGFGADSTEVIKEHPKIHGMPDLTIYNGNDEIFLIEVSGTEYMRGDDYWVRPDKVKFIQDNPDKNILIALHYQNSKNGEKIVWIRPVIDKHYSYERKQIKNAIEFYVIFNDSSLEIVSPVEVVSAIKAAMKA